MKTGEITIKVVEEGGKYFGYVIYNAMQLASATSPNREEVKDSLIKQLSERLARTYEVLTEFKPD